MKRAALMMLMVCFAAPLLAGTVEREEAKVLLDGYLKENGGLEQALQAPPVDIPDRTRLCGFCHGKDGNSTHPDIPSLAGQNPIYFLEQVRAFQKEQRYPITMHGIAQRMDEQEMVAIALHYSRLPRRLVLVGEGGEEEMRLGGELYRQRCVRCHGKDGTGDEGGEVYANLRGQRPDYLTTTITRFREGDRKRPSHEMGDIVSGFSDQEIQALATYISQM